MQDRERAWISSHDLDPFAHDIDYRPNRGAPRPQPGRSWAAPAPERPPPCMRSRWASRRGRRRVSPTKSAPRAGAPRRLGVGTLLISTRGAFMSRNAERGYDGIAGSAIHASNSDSPPFVAAGAQQRLLALCALQLAGWPGQGSSQSSGLHAHLCRWARGTTCL